MRSSADFKNLSCYSIGNVKCRLGFDRSFGLSIRVTKLLKNACYFKLFSTIWFVCCMKVWRHEILLERKTWGASFIFRAPQSHERDGQQKRGTEQLFFIHIKVFTRSEPLIVWDIHFICTTWIRRVLSCFSSIVWLFLLSMIFTLSHCSIFHALFVH